MVKITELDSLYDDLEKKDSTELLHLINREDHKVPEIVKVLIPEIKELTDKVYSMLKAGGRLFYMGSGTSGRLGIVDASECPPTFGVSHDLVIGLIAGGDSAIRRAVEDAEDNPEGGWEDLRAYDVSSRDIVVGLAASGTTPYVVGALKRCRKNNIPTGCICCNPDSPVEKVADYPIVAIVGPEFVTGSTRMKAGTAQKLILNMISTTVMIKLGRVEGNKMVDMQLSNAKLVERGIKMIKERHELSYKHAKELLEKHGSVRAVYEKLAE